MNSALKAAKKGFAWSVVVTTTLWSMGVAALAPMAAQAVECPALQAGSQFKVAGDPAVYVLNQNLQPLFFPNANVYKTWYADYSGVVTIASSCFDNYSLPTMAPYGVNYRPGTLVKLQASNSVYVVESGNKIRRIASEAAAAMLAGSNWNRKVYDVHPAFWANLTVVSGDNTGMPVNGMLVKLASSADVYMVEAGMLRKVVGGAPSFLSSYVMTVPQSTFSSFGMGSDAMRADVTMDPTQGAGSNVGPNPNPTPNPTPGPTPTGGALSVGLSASTPVGTTLSNNTAYNEVLKVNLMANSSAVRLSGVTVKKTGLVANSKISGVSAWVDGMRLGDVMSSFNSEDKVTINFGADAIDIPAGSSKVLTVAFNLASDATGGTVGAQIALPADVITNGTVSGAFPVMGNMFGLTDGDDSLSTVTLQGQSVGGLSSEPSSATAGNVEIGEVKDLLKVRISETSGNNDVHLKNLRVYFQGSLQDRDVTDLELRAPDNTVLGTAAQITDRYVSFNIVNGYTIPEGSNRVVTLRGKIADGSGNYFRAQVQNDYDILLQDASTGFYVLPSSFSTVSSSDGWTKMKSGSATVSKRNDSPSTRVSAGATDRVLARYDLKAVGEDLEIRKAALRVATSSASTVGLTGNVRVVVDGVTVLTVSAGSSLYGSATQYNLSQYINIASGETKVVEIIGNIPTTATGSATYTAYFGNLYTKRLSTNDFTDLATSVVAGNTLTADTTSLTLSKDTSLGNRTASPGSKIEVGRFVVRAGDAEAINITNATVSFNGGGGFSAPTHLKNLELRDANNNALGSTLSTAATSSNSFSFSLSLAANEQKVIKVWADSESTATATTSASITVTYVGQSTSNSDTSSAVTGQTITFGAANVVIAASNDSTTISSIRTPSSAPMQLGKWSIKAENETVTVERLTFQVVDDSLASDTSAGNFGTLYLYDSNNMSTPIGSASYTPGSSAGYVRFTGLNYSVGADETKYLVLKGEINGSGTMDVASINAFAIRSNNDSNDIRIVAASGGELALAQIDNTTSGANTTSVRFATSSFYLFHNSAPVIASVNIGSSLEQSSQAKIFQFSITNSGDREMRITTTTINVAASGLTANGTATGTIGTWQLWEANSSGGLGTQLASTSTASLAGGIGITNGVNAAAGNTLNVTFGPANQQNGLLDNFTIPVNSSRTLILVADTTAMFNGKASGVGQITVSVSPKLDGATGYSASNSAFETNWADGVVQYYYTPVNGSQNSTAYTASDSYDVVGTSLSRQG